MINNLFFYFKTVKPNIRNLNLLIYLVLHPLFPSVSLYRNQKGLHGVQKQSKKSKLKCEMRNVK